MIAPLRDPEGRNVEKKLIGVVSTNESDAESAAAEVCDGPEGSANCRASGATREIHHPEKGAFLFVLRLPTVLRLEASEDDGLTRRRCVRGRSDLWAMAT